MTEKKQPVKITVSALKEQVHNGMKRKELAEYYGISEMQMAKALKAAGLTIRKFHAPSFELVEEEDTPDIYVPEEDRTDIEEDDYTPRLVFSDEVITPEPDSYRDLYK